MNCLVVKKIRKKVNGYLKNITENELETINENAIITKNKINYIKDNVKHTILFKEKELILLRETNEFKNILTFSKNRSILCEYIIKNNDLVLEIEVKTLELFFIICCNFSFIRILFLHTYFIFINSIAISYFIFNIYFIVII